MLEPLEAKKSAALLLGMNIQHAGGILKKMTKSSAVDASLQMLQLDNDAAEDVLVHLSFWSGPSHFNTSRHDSPLVAKMSQKAGYDFQQRMRKKRTK